MSEETKYLGSCFCGEVEFVVTGEPHLMAHCHCDSCRHWSAGQVTAFTLWKPEQIAITKGEASIESFNKTPGSTRQWCKICGGHLFIDHPAMGLVDIPAVIIKDFLFKAAIHVNYQETVHVMKDGLPKFKDLPAEAGGSGEKLPE